MDNRKIKSPDDFLEQFEEISKVLSFEKESDIIVISVKVSDFSLEALKSISETTKKVTGHECIIIPDTVKISSSTKEQVLKNLSNMIYKINELPDDSFPTGISW